MFLYCYILPNVVFGFKGQILVVLKPLQIFCGVNVFLRARETHCATSPFPPPFPLFVSVQTSLYALNAVLNSLKDTTLKGFKGHG